MSYRGHFSDGLVALRHNVDVWLWGGDLCFRNRDRSVDEQWSGNGLTLLEEAYPGKPLRLAHGDHPDAVVTVDDRHFAQSLIEAHARLGRKVMRGTTRNRVLTWSAISLAVIATLIVGAPRLAAAMSHYVPAQWEADLGQRVTSELIAGSTVCSGAAGNAVLNDLAQELAALRGYDGSITLRVVDDPLVNAFAGPGGQLVVYRGLIDTAQSGEQVAGVLAHEVAHIVEHHPMEGVAEQLALRFVLTMLIGDVSEMSMIAAKAGGELLGSSYSRAMENEADAVAVALLNEAGYDAQGIAGFFELLDDSGIGDMPDLLTWLSSHPLHAARSEAVRAANRGGRPALSDAAWHDIQAVCTSESADPNI